MISPIEIVQAACSLAIACVLLLTLIKLVNITSRYERFRNEVAEITANLIENMDDINKRLIAAGYPPGRVLPATDMTYPGWAQRDRR